MPQPCYILSHGRLRRKNNTLAFEDTDEQGNTRRRYIPIESVSEIYLFGQVDLNSSALSFLAQHHIPMHVFSFYGWYRGTYLPKTPRYYGKLLVEQVQHYLDPARRLVLAREFLTGALTHIKHNLEYYRRRGRQCEESVNAVATALAALPSCSTIASLLQWEGAARKAYYQAVNAIVHLAKPYPGRTYHPLVMSWMLRCHFATGCSMGQSRAPSIGRCSIHQLDSYMSRVRGAHHWLSTLQKFSSRCWQSAWFFACSTGSSSRKPRFRKQAMGTVASILARQLASCW